jgi:hypothetical protein
MDKSIVSLLGWLLDAGWRGSVLCFPSSVRRCVCELLAAGGM